MCEAEKWEGDVQQLFDGLESSDKILSARLEHDLTAEDLPNDTQVGCLILVCLFEMRSFNRHKSRLLPLSFQIQ